MNISKSIILNTDSYKTSHWLQYPPNTEFVFSYIEARGGVYQDTTFFGLQMFLKEYLSKPITQSEIDFATTFYEAHGVPFNREGWMKLLAKHNGYLPLRIKAVKEGVTVPIKNVLVTVENTDPEFYWATSYIETALLRAVWYPTTVCTMSRNSKKVIKNYLDRTGDPTGLSFKLHDFGSRGVSSFESAGIGDAAHLVNFMGTDTVTGVLTVMEYYNATTMPAFSIPASEHSSITSWGRDNETAAYANMLKQFGREGTVLACVSDSYDIINACKIWGTTLKQQVIDSGATVVVRPDSGHPETVVSQVVHELDKYFGSTVNDKGYKVLNNVRVIQGDGINEASIRGILLTLEFSGYSADNIAFGQGGALLQQLNRDTQQWAMKCSWAQINGVGVDVYKDPVGDTTKKSKKGKITLVKTIDGVIKTVLESDVSAICAAGGQELLETVWLNGELLKDFTFDDIRSNASI